MNKNSSPLKHWWHYIPFLLLLPLLLAFYLDPWGGTVLLFLFPPVTLVLASVLVAWAVLVLIRSFKIGGLHKKLIVSLSVLSVLAVIFLVAVRIPAWDCDAEKLAKHYEQKKDAIEELVAYARTAFDEGESPMVYVDGTLKEDVGLDEEEMRTIRKLLKKSRCRHIQTFFPDYCEICYKTIVYGPVYGYRIYLAPMTEEQRQEVVDSPRLSPYSDRVALLLDGNAEPRQTSGNSQSSTISQ